MVNIMAETGDEKSQDFKVAQDGQTTTVLEEGIAEVSHREGMRPVVVRRVTVAFLHHQYKSVQGKEWSEKYISSLVSRPIPM